MPDRAVLTAHLPRTSWTRRLRAVLRCGSTAASRIEQSFAYALCMSRPHRPSRLAPGCRPPDAPRWELTAEAWLLDLCPPEYRGYPTLRRHVVVLARFAVLHVEGCQVACRRGLSEAGPS